MGGANLEAIAVGPGKSVTEAVLEAAERAGIAVSVTMIDDASIVYVNEAAARIVGVPIEELRKRHALEFVAPEDRARMEAMMADRRAGRAAPDVYAVILARRDGTRVPVELARSNIRIDGRPATVAFFVDVSARRAAEQALQGSYAQLRRLIEHAPDGIGLVQDGKFLFVNPALARMLGHAAPEALVRTSWTAQVHPDDVPRFEGGGEAVLARGEPLRSSEFRVRRVDGESVILEITAIPLDWDDGPALLGFARDVTIQRRLRAQLVQNDRLAALGTLAAGIAHEMNNPLAYATLQLELLERDLHDDDSAPLGRDDIASRIAAAREGLDRVTATVRELRVFARTESDERGPVSVRRAVEIAGRLASGSLRAHGRLVIDLDQLPPVTAQQARLEQVFLNLIVNAAQALPEETVERNEIYITGRHDAAAGTVIVEVRDNGQGIEAAILGRIFDPFFTTKPSGIGTGLGLSICHGIVTSLGGDIDVTSVPGYGTTFRVTLPAHDAQVPASPPPPASAERGTRRLRVLIVDDEPSLAITLAKLLEDVHDTAWVSSARDAIALLERGETYDVVLCDLTMPDVTGMELFETAATRWPGLEHRFVFMTGGAFTEQASRFLARVRNPRVEKPFQVEEISRAMQSIPPL